MAPRLYSSHIIFSILLLSTSPLYASSQFFDLFLKDCAELSNEKTFEEGIAHWRSLFRNDSIIEMNDRVKTTSHHTHSSITSLTSCTHTQIFEGSNEIDAYFQMHASTFRRIQFDVVGDNVVESMDGILSVTLYATYVPREYLGCSSMMRWLAIFWYDSDRKIKKMQLSSSTSLTQWKAQLECDWIAEPEQIEYSFNKLMSGMYRDNDVETMVTTHYALNAKLYINEGADHGGNLIEGRENVIAWYLDWEQLGVSDVMNEIDEMDINGNSMMVRMVSIASHASGQCSQSFMWYGLYRFNGKGQIVHEQRFYHQKQLETSKLVLGNCGDMSPLPKDDL